MPLSWTSCRPAMSTSCSVSLLIILNPQWLIHWMISPMVMLGPSQVRPLWRYLNRQLIASTVEWTSLVNRSPLSARASSIGGKSAMKSSRACDFMAFRGWNEMSYSLSSTAHFVCLLESFDLCKMFWSGKLVNTVIGWHYKHGCNFLAGWSGHVLVSLTDCSESLHQEVICL